MCVNAPVVLVFVSAARIPKKNQLLASELIKKSHINAVEENIFCSEKNACAIKIPEICIYVKCSLKKKIWNLL